MLWKWENPLFRLGHCQVRKLSGCIQNSEFSTRRPNRKNHKNTWVLGLVNQSICVCCFLVLQGWNEPLYRIWHEITNTFQTWCCPFCLHFPFFLRSIEAIYTWIIWAKQHFKACWKDMWAVLKPVGNSLCFNGWSMEISRLWEAGCLHFHKKD